MKLYQRTFVNPLLALAFKDGVDFGNDPDLKALEPKREGPNKWVVLVEDHDDDDEEDSEETVVEVSCDRTASDDAKPTWDEIKDSINVDMTPLTPPSASIDRAAIRSGQDFSLLDESSGYPCGKCLNCKMGQDCIEEINAACRTYRSER